MRTWSFYRAIDGALLGREYSAANDKFLAHNTPSGCVAIEGRYDRERQRVDLQTKLVVDDPELAHSNAEKRAEGVRRELARARILDLERRQARPQRELLIDPTNAEARQRLTEIDREIAQLRPQL